MEPGILQMVKEAARNATVGDQPLTQQQKDYMGICEHNWSSYQPREEKEKDVGKKEVMVNVQMRMSHRLQKENQSRKVRKVHEEQTIE